METADAPPTLATLARDAGLSPWHFQRLFKAAVGVSPKRYAMAQRQRRLGRQLNGAASVTEAIYDAGYASSSAAYRDSQALGMAPRALRAGGANELIRYAVQNTSLGHILIAATERGICLVEFCSTEPHHAMLQQRFPNARIEKADRATGRWVRQVVETIDDPARESGLPLDIRGTAFQVRVWNALTRLKPGETVSYGELARRIRAPGSSRAVARACATNHIAVLVPCHRVVGSDGALTGYKWGVERKRALLEQEGSLPAAATPGTRRRG